MRPDISLKSLFIVFLFFFGFLEVVATFGQKPKKHRETKKMKKTKKNKKAKKQKKPKIRRLHEARHFPQMCFFCFLEGFFGFAPKVAKTLRRLNTTKISGSVEGKPEQEDSKHSAFFSETSEEPQLLFAITNYYFHGSI